jgi:hypothetical protein
MSARPTVRQRSWRRSGPACHPGAVGMGKAWSLRRSLLARRHGRTVQDNPAVATCRPESATGGKCPPPAASPAAETARAQCCYARRSRPWPGWATPETLASQAGAAVPRAVDPRRAGGCHPQCGMVGISNHDMVASSPTGAPSPAPAPRVGGRIRHDRSPDRRSPGRGHPALARTPAPRTHGNRRIPPSAAAHCRPGTPPVRPDSLTWRLATLRDGEG